MNTGISTAEDLPRSTILIVDDEEAHAEAIREGLSRMGHECIVATSGKEGLEQIREKSVDVVITDLVMNDVDGMEILKAAKEKSPDIEVIMITGHGSVESAVEAMKQGAATYLTKPVNLDELRMQVRQVIEKQGLGRRNVELQRRLNEKFGFEGIIGNTLQMHKLFETVRQIADTSATVLIIGESGTGKEMFAQAIHNNSRRRNKPFVTLDCAALSEGVLESELFGHEKGAFTHAVAQRKGRFEYANGGTLFLDEVSEMPITTQVKFLRVLEKREVVRVGGNEPIPIDVRLIAASGKDLEEEVRKGNFRQDLFYRLKVVTLHLPPLRERKMDIPLLVDAFIKEFAQRHERNVRGISQEAMNVLYAYDWPGNVRELKNCIESMVVITRNEILQVEDIPIEIRRSVHKETTVSPVTPTVGMTLAEMERELILNTLRSVGGNREKAAKILGIGLRTLYRKLKEYKRTTPDLEI